MTKLLKPLKQLKSTPIPKKSPTLKFTTLSRFKVAFRGIFMAISTQRNMKIHLIAATGVILLGFFTHLSKPEWIAILLCIFLVLVTELINTALEQTVDLVTRKRRYRAMLAKDMAAGAVLLSSLLAVIIGILIFFDKLNYILT